MTATGRTSWEAADQPPPATRVAVPGSQPSQTTKMLARNTPSANSGTEATVVLNSRMARSSREDSRIPAAIPRAAESGTMTMKAMAPRKRLLPRRLQMMSLTGTLNRVE